MIAKDASDYDVGQYSNIKISELNAKLENVTMLYEAAQAKAAELENHLEVFQKEKKLYMEQKHKDIIDALIASRRDEMGKFSGYLDYCIEIDYSKTVEQVEKDIKEIHYNFLLKNNKAGGKKSFSAIEADVADSVSKERNAIAERYGEDIAKYFK
jgi:flagellin-specific chaperone FliS